MRNRRSRCLHQQNVECFDCTTDKRKEMRIKLDVRRPRVAFRKVGETFKALFGSIVIGYPVKTAVCGFDSHCTYGLSPG